MAALLVAAGAAGCSGQSKPAPTPSASTSTSTSAPSSTTPSPSSSTPSPTSTGGLPEAAKAHTRAGAEAFIRYFFEQLNVAFTTPKAKLISSLAEAGCGFCADNEADVVQLVRKGHRYATAPIRLGKLVPAPRVIEEQVVFTVTVDQVASDVVDRAGRVVRNDSAGSLKARVAAIWQGERWQFLEMESQ